MSWVTSLVGLVRGFYFLLKEMGSYGRPSHRRDSFCLVSHLLTRLSCLKAEAFLCEPSSEGRLAAMSSGAPWLREGTRQPRLRKEGLAMAQQPSVQVGKTNPALRSLVLNRRRGSPSSGSASPLGVPSPWSLEDTGWAQPPKPLPCCEDYV